MAGRFFSIEVRGLAAFKVFEDLPRAVDVAASRAINSATDKARTRSSRNLRAQINFGARYLSGTDGKITTAEKAKAGKLVARLTASSRPTSLARFALNRAARRGAGVRVMVSPGDVKHLRGAFFVRLRAGSRDGVNLGVAIRSKTKPPTAYKPKRMGRDLWLLYGPSVAQALISARESGIWPNMEPEIALDAEEEFLRQIDLLGKTR